mmetsp:Transcript_36620/g.72016  ORF Transcript_36620/g.72016 Transcript_36620/m.72016 type:complete len:102 (+) Transcript_36620:264-569(+)
MVGKDDVIGKGASLVVGKDVSFVVDKDDVIGEGAGLVVGKVVSFVVGKEDCESAGEVASLVFGKEEAKGSGEDIPVCKLKKIPNTKAITSKKIIPPTAKIF